MAKTKTTDPIAKVRTTKLVELATIQTHPKNANHGDAGAISISLGVLGQFRAIVVSEASGNILAGNHTYLAAKMNGDQKMLAHLLVRFDGGPLTPEDEIRVMTADNQYARLAYSDDALLAETLLELQQSNLGLLATGYDEDLLDDMMADLDTTLFLPVDGDEQGQLDTVKGDTRIECPKCAHSFPWADRANK